MSKEFAALKPTCDVPSGNSLLSEFQAVIELLYLKSGIPEDSASLG